MPRRFAWLTVALFGGLAAMLVASGIRFIHSRSAAYAARQNLDECRQLAARIESLKTAPIQASLEQRTQKDLAQKIEQAAQLAEIPAGAILSISPQAGPGRRLGKSSLLAQVTNIHMRDVTLKQLVKFLIEVSADESGLQATTLRLTAPRTAPPSEAEERWAVELVLTYLMFSPEYAPAHSGDILKSGSK